MIAEADVQEYLDAIREQVCARCVERPPGGPPCAPLGKNCGVEMHLPLLIESVRQVHSGLLQPYLEHNRHEICSHCAFLNSSICPCPMDYLAALVVEAVEDVDQRREQRGQGRFLASLPTNEGAELEEVLRAYTAGAGTWTGCDWTTTFGKNRVDLNGVTAAAAQALANTAASESGKENWRAAARWLAQVECAARQAEAAAAAAVAAARAGEWRQALAHAERAWALEFSTGRPIWHSYPVAWQKLRRAIEAGCAAQANPVRVG
ncbi:MAG: hypothetical protein L0Z62_14975 [Gemmataceae bacterium]|nr:hypothetical protein [Gemmataceae bacterium]